MLVADFYQFPRQRLSSAFRAFWERQTPQVVPDVEFMSLHLVSRFTDSKSVVKLCGARGPFCLPHTEAVLVPKQCPLVWRLTTIAPSRPRTGNQKIRVNQFLTV